MAFDSSVSVKKSARQPAKNFSKNKASKKKPVSSGSHNSSPNPLAELLKAIESGFLGPMISVERVPKSALSEDVFAQSFGRIADKLVRTDERIDKLAAAVEQLLHRSGPAETSVASHSPELRDREKVTIAAPPLPQQISMDESIKILSAVANRISEYVEEHRIRYAPVTNQASKSDVMIDAVPPATCELQACIHSITHTLLVAHAELREMASRAVV